MPPSLDPHVLAYYEQGREDARLAPVAGNEADSRLEFWRTQDVLRRALPAPPARVLDVGGASGRHAAWLRADGYDVELLDPVPLHVRQARAKGIPAREGDARQLPEDDDSFDVVLVLGPLYHLPARADRVRALAEARRVVRPGGLVAAATINRWAVLHDGLLKGFFFEAHRREHTMKVLRTGHQDSSTDLFTVAYFHDPAEIPGEFADAGLSRPVPHGLEGAAWLTGGMRERLDDPEQRAVVLDALREVETEPALLGVSGHVLTTARA
ncbi:class I SAM-dependent methyltransferase [Streptomyces litchfieldiae]|uniref:Methyltransferase domain-containing protein n=1 Tax=Streptomyces litchfieldiae TaxID=3075543 RepID=A0ABU2MRW8_9ACTN|nr:methyltransferase domain-containing protein [Streptomyces sp. DSM 44938]MDT0344360.1 methyltransferase domain-containing protein [Streptomyces sp. DSM 44938]